MQVLLTGSTGLIGSAIAARLLADGHEVTGVAARWRTSAGDALDHPRHTQRITSRRLAPLS